MKELRENSWLKNRGYLHITPKIDAQKFESKIIATVKNDRYVAKHSFFPLLHYIVKERRFKKIELNKRAHSFLDKKSNKHKKTEKLRPIHYATHCDALIYGYYAELLQLKYEERLINQPGLSKCITAYRKVPHENECRNKNSIDFAKDAFAEIKQLAQIDVCCALKFDVKSFFSSLDHNHLKLAWSDIIGKEMLPDSHLNVYKAVTNFSYILLDDLRVSQVKKGRRAGFNEKKLAENRKRGINAFFGSVKEFREKVKNKELSIYKNPFRHPKSKVMRGIPQGLPISAVLANIYLLEFDSIIYQKVVLELNGVYKRYCDDIIIACGAEYQIEIEKLVEDTIDQYQIEISPEKTDIFRFRSLPKLQGGHNYIQCFKVEKDGVEKPGFPFSYLGFEFYGEKILVKSSNIAKFYRRMIRATKRKARRIKLAREKYLIEEPNVFSKKLFMLYSCHGKKSKFAWPDRRIWVTNTYGEYCYIKKPRRKEVNKNGKSELGKPVKKRGNYLTYIDTASRRIGQPYIKKQLRNHVKILKNAMEKHYSKIYK